MSCVPAGKVTIWKATLQQRTWEASWIPDEHEPAPKAANKKGTKVLPAALRSAAGGMRGVTFPWTEH